MEKLSITYKISKEAFMEGYDVFYRQKKAKSTYIKAALFAAALLLFIQQVWMDPYFTMGWVCIVICIGAILCILATPKMDRQNYERALKGLEGDTYRLSIENRKISVETVILDNDDKCLDADSEGNLLPHPEIKPTVIDMDDKSYRTVETDKIFVVMTKDYSLVIPKEPLSIYDTEALRDGLKK